MINFHRFSISPVKVRILYIKKLLNEIGYNLEENIYDDKLYKKSLKKFQIENNFVGNCTITPDVFNALLRKVPNANKIWESMR